MNDFFIHLPLKIELVAATIKKLQEKIHTLEKENKNLIEKIEGMASALHMHTSDVKMLTEEKESITTAIDELIKSIDSLIAPELQ